MSVLSLIYGPDEEEAANPRLQFVQDPRQRPAPIQRPDPVYRPGEEPRARRAPQQAPAAAPPVMAQPQPAPQPVPDLSGESAYDLMFKPETPAATPAPAIAQPKPGAEPDAPTWFGRRMQDIRGKQDPRFKDLPEFVDTEGARTLPLLAGKAVAGDDQVYGDIVAASLGDRLIRREKDANDYEIVTYRGDDGREVSAYVNRPGLNLEDVNRTAFAAVPYVVGAGVAGKALQKIGANALGRIFGQAATAGSTSVLNDIGAQALGSEQDVNTGRALVAAGTGGAAELVGTVGTALYRRFVTEPGLYNRASGELTDKGIELARKAGVDPDAIRGDLAKEFASTYAKTGSEAQAAISAQRVGTGVPVSKGQLTKDKQQLLREEAMRRGIYGEDAKRVMLGFDEQQRQAVTEAAVGPFQTGNRSSVASTVAPNARAVPTLQSTAEAVQGNTASALGKAKAGERQAWETARSVGPLQPTQQALEKLPEVFARRGVADIVDVGLGDLPSTTPTALRMIRELESYAAGEAPKAAVSPLLKPSARTDVDSVRQRLFGVMKGTTDPRDRNAASEVYDAYDEWMAEAAQQNLLQGDQLGAAVLRTARDATKGLKQIFEPRDGGKLTPAARIIGKIAKAGDSPEMVVRNLFGGQGITAEGKVAAVRQLKKAYSTYLDPKAAKAAADDLKLAYWTKLVRDRRGETVDDIASTKMMLNALDDAFGNQRSILRELFNPAELARMQQFRETLRRINYTDPNASGSSYGVASFVKEAVVAFMNGLGLNSVPIQMLVRYSGVSNIYGSVQARRAVSQAIPKRPPNALIGGTITGATVPARSD